MKKDEKLSAVYALFRYCTDSELERITLLLKERIYRKNEVVYFAGEPSEYLYIIEEGFIDLSFYPEESGKDIHAATLLRGDSFGIGEVYFDTYYVTARSLTDCKLFAISKSDFMMLQRDIPSINQYVIKTLSYLVRENFFRQNQKSSRIEFDNFLYYLANEYGRMCGDLLMIPVNHSMVTHEKIASILNLSREQVSRLFSLYLKEKIIHKDTSYYIVDTIWYNEQKERLTGLNFRRVYLAAN